MSTWKFGSISKYVKITDIRKLSEFYIFTVGISEGVDPMGLPTELPSTGVEIPDPLMVKDRIFEERLKPYFLKDAHRVTREEIKEVRWNMYISKGYYIKIAHGEVKKYEMDPEKYYVSYLEISGPLGTFQSVYKDKELN